MNLRTALEHDHEFRGDDPPEEAEALLKGPEVSEEDFNHVGMFPDFGTTPYNSTLESERLWSRRSRG